MTDILIHSGARTPFALWAAGTRPDGQKGGAFKPYDPFQLAAAALKGALAKASVKPDQVERLVFANCYHVGPHACYGGRYVASFAGLPNSVPSLTVNLACGAGLLAVASAAEEIAGGRAQVVAATGADSSSNVPRNVFVPSFKDALAGCQIAEASQKLSASYGITRKDQDRWAKISHERASKARREGWFAEEIVPLGETAQDDAIIDDPTDERFAGAKVLFEGSDATAGNTHAVVDGGGALVMAARGALPEAPVLGRFVGWAVAGVDPEKMGYAAVPAIRRVLSQAGWKTSEVDLWEINETFASQTLVDIKELSLPEDRVNVHGGALALGHPFGGTGPRLALTLLRALKARGQKRGVASISVGGGQGIAVALEAL